MVQANTTELSRIKNARQKRLFMDALGFGCLPDYKGIPSLNPRQQCPQLD